MKDRTFACCLSVLMGFLGALAANSVGAAVAKIEQLITRPLNIERGSGAMWSNVDGVSPQIWSFSDHVLVGGAANKIPESRSGTSTWLSRPFGGPDWIPRDSQFVSIATHGNIAVAGASRSGDAAGLKGDAAAIGSAGFALSDRDHSAAWAAYFECQLEPGTLRQCYGAELDVKNKGPNSIGTPFGVGIGGHALWLAGGGDNSYGGISANPSTSAVTIVRNSNTWNTGITVAKDAITGCDGGGSRCQAMKLAIGQGLCWYSSATNSACLNAALVGGRAVALTLPGYTPMSKVEACAAGAMAWDDAFLYICTNGAHWKKIGLSSL